MLVRYCGPGCGLADSARLPCPASAAATARSCTGSAGSACPTTISPAAPAGSAWRSMPARSGGGPSASPLRRASPAWPTPSSCPACALCTRDGDRSCAAAARKCPAGCGGPGPGYRGGGLRKQRRTVGRAAVRPGPCRAGPAGRNGPPWPGDDAADLPAGDPAAIEQAFFVLTAIIGLLTAGYAASLRRGRPASGI
jgi:hypothetical protein